MRINEIKSRLERRSGSIGGLEILAGIERDEVSRRDFWLGCNREAQSRFNVAFASGEQVFHVGRERCYAMIAKRIKSGQLSLI